MWRALSRTRGIKVAWCYVRGPHFSSARGCQSLLQLRCWWPRSQPCPSPAWLATLLAQTLTCRLTFWLDLSPVVSPQMCLAAGLGDTPSCLPGLPCSLAGLVGWAPHPHGHPPWGFPAAPGPLQWLWVLSPSLNTIQMKRVLFKFLLSSVNLWVGVMVHLQKVRSKTRGWILQFQPWLKIHGYS